MKTLMTFAAVAALVSSVSIASAQTTMQNNSTAGVASGTNGAFCVDIRGAKNCKFQTMADCQKEAGKDGTCVPNSNAKGSTTGSASGSMGAKPMGASGSAGTNSQMDTQKGANSMDKGGASSKGH
jgi:hypothetical protein